MGQSSLSTLAARQLPQDFTKFFSGWCHVTVCGAGDADDVNR
jgi:hypothetical protein